MFRIEKVRKYKLFEDLYELVMTLEFLMNKYFLTETKVSSCIIE